MGEEEVVNKQTSMGVPGGLTYRQWHLIYSNILVLPSLETVPRLCTKSYKLDRDCNLTYLAYSTELKVPGGVNLLIVNKSNAERQK